MGLASRITQYDLDSTVKIIETTTRSSDTLKAREAAYSSAYVKMLHLPCNCFSQRVLLRNFSKSIISTGTTNESIERIVIDHFANRNSQSKHYEKKSTHKLIKRSNA